VAHGSSGFTILELVIALTILAVIGAVAFEAVRIGARSWQRAEERAEREQRARVVAAMLRADLAGLLPVSAVVDGRQVLAFKGESDRLYFQAAPDPGESHPRNGLVRSLTYSVEGGRGLLLQRAYALAEDSVSREPVGPIEVLDPGVTRLRFRYLQPPESEADEPRWVERWEPELPPVPPQNASMAQRAGALPGAQAQAGKGLPLAIEASLTLGEGRDAREFVVLVPVRLTGRL
jgi:general secretion pathway protein J